MIRYPGTTFATPTDLHDLFIHFSQITVTALQLIQLHTRFIIRPTRFLIYSSDHISAQKLSMRCGRPLFGTRRSLRRGLRSLDGRFILPRSLHRWRRHGETRLWCWETRYSFVGSREAGHRWWFGGSLVLIFIVFHSTARFLSLGEFLGFFLFVPLK